MGGAGAITTNLVIPLLWKTSRYSALGPYFSLLVVSFSAHAIIRYRLMDIRVVIRQGVVYVSAIFASISVFLVVAKIYQLMSGFDTSNIPLADALILATLVAVVFQPLKAWIQRSFNRYVYREKYDFQRTLREASRQLSSTLDLQSLLQYLCVTIEDTFKAEGVTVYLRAPREKAYVAQRLSPSLGWARSRGRFCHSSPVGRRCFHAETEAAHLFTKRPSVTLNIVSPRRLPNCKLFAAPSHSLFPMNTHSPECWS